MDVESELSVQATGSELASLRTDKRKQTIVFKMPSKRHYFIAFTVQAFKEFGCKWVGLVNDCYILYASFLDSQLISFNPDFLLKKVNESNEDVQEDIIQNNLHQILQILAVRWDVNCTGQSIFKHLGERSEDGSEDAAI